MKTLQVTTGQRPHHVDFGKERTERGLKQYNVRSLEQKLVLPEAGTLGHMLRQTDDGNLELG